MYTFLLIVSKMLFFFSLFWESYLGFWFCLELAMLLLIPCFFYNKKNKNVYLGLLCYVMANSLSSCFLVSGLLMSFNEVFIIVSFIMKMGMFPFYSWFFYLVKNLKWLMMFSVVVVSKLIFVYFLKYGFESSFLFFVKGLIMVKFLILTYVLKTSVYDLKSFYSVTSISSGLILLYLMLNSYVISIFVLYMVYFMINIFIIWSFSYMNKTGLSIYAVCLLIGVPFSLYIFYKGFSVFCLAPFNSYLLVLFWAVFSMFEQILLYNLLLEKAYLNISV